MVLNADFCNSTLPGQLGNCALSATLRIDAQSSGLDACFLGNNGCSDDPIVVGVGGPVLIAVTSLGAAPSNQSLRIRASFENINHSSSSATLDLAVVPPPFLTGPSSVRVIRGRASQASDQDPLVHRGRYDVVTSRAVAALPKLVQWCEPLMEPDGRIVALKGSSAAREVEESRGALRKRGLVADVHPERAYPDAEPTWLVLCRRARR